MKLWPVLFLASSLTAQYGGSMVVGSPATPLAITNLALSPSASTIVATWQTSVQADSQLSCGAIAGTYNLAAVDGGMEGGVLRHQAIVSGLAAATAYFCQVSSTSGGVTVKANTSSATTAVAGTTPITGVSFSTFLSYNALNSARQMKGDTFYNTQGADGNTYLTTDDTNTEWTGGGYIATASNSQLAVFEGTFPTSGHAVNPLSGYGVNSSKVAPEGLSFKTSGLLGMNGKLFLATGRQLNPCCSGYTSGQPFTQYHGEIMWSPDYGKTWNTYQAPTVLNPNGVPTTAAMFGTTPSYFSSATFVMYGLDDGTLGYLNPVNRHDNGEAWVYLVANEHYWNNGSNFYMARVARAKITRLLASDYQYFIGASGADGNLDTNWSTDATKATPILTAANQLSETNVQYIPALNRYVLLNNYYPDFSLGTGNAAYSKHTVWTIYESPKPWGPWTQVSSTDYPTLGWYNPIILQSTAQTGNAPTIFFSGDFTAYTNYSLWYSTMTLQH